MGQWPDLGNPIRGNRRFSMPLHRPLWMRSKNTEEYVDLAIEKVVQVHTENLSRTGDILLFLPGKEEVWFIDTYNKRQGGYDVTTPFTC